MEGHSVQLLYRSPGTLSAWFAPETVRWLVLLVAVPFVALWLLWRVVGPPFRAWAAKNMATPKDTYPAECAARAYAHPGYQNTLLVLVYAALLLAAAATGVHKLGIYNDTHTSMYINTAPGLPAATALLSIPALGMLIASIATAVAGPYYGAAVAEAGFLRVIWCFSGAGGFGFAGIFSGIAGGAVVAVWETLAGLLLIAGLWLRSSYAAKGHAVAERTRAAEQALQRGHVERRAMPLEAVGRYHGTRPIWHWGRIVGMGLVPPVFFVGSTVLLERGTVHGPLTDPGFWLVAWGGGLVFGTLVWLTIRRRAREVEWDEQGVEVTWYAGQVRRFAWDELVTLKQTQGDGGGVDAVVTTASGEKFAVISGHAGQEQIVSALEVHIWGRGTTPHLRGARRRASRDAAERQPSATDEASRQHRLSKESSGYAALSLFLSLNAILTSTALTTVRSNRERVHDTIGELSGGLVTDWHFWATVLTVPALVCAVIAYRKGRTRLSMLSLGIAVVATCVTWFLMI